MSRRAHEAGGADSRPISVPDDVDDPRDRNRVYEVVLREGIDDDVRYFIDPDVLAAEWDNLVLPPRARRAWIPWFLEHRALELEL